MGEQIFLSDIGGPQPTPGRDRAAIRLFIPSEDAEEGRLARAIRTDQAHPFAVTDTEGDVVEERPRAVGLNERLTA